MSPLPTSSKDTWATWSPNSTAVSNPEFDDRGAVGDGDFRDVKGSYAPRREAMEAPLDKADLDTDLGRGVLGYLLAPNPIDGACVRALEAADPRVERQPPSDSPLIGRPSGRRRR